MYRWTPSQLYESVFQTYFYQSQTVVKNKTSSNILQIIKQDKFSSKVDPKITFKINFKLRGKFSFPFLLNE